MRQFKLHLDDLSVESFNTTTELGHRGTVDGHAEVEGTFLSFCKTCDGFTCEHNMTCAPEHTCVHNMTCAPEYTCVAPCDGGGETIIEQ